MSGLVPVRVELFQRIMRNGASLQDPASQETVASNHYELGHTRLLIKLTEVPKNAGWVVYEALLSP